MHAERGATPTDRLSDLTDSYARRIYPAVCGAERGQFVCSPLGVWLLLAALASCGRSEAAGKLEEFLGCDAREAADLLSALLADPPPALSMALSLWIRGFRPGTFPWENLLPPEIDVGDLPTQAEADAWVREHSLGLINGHPADMRRVESIVTSVLATKVSWTTPFSLVASSELGPDSSWPSTVSRVLRSPTSHDVALYDTTSAGRVAAHSVVARDGLRVTSVIGGPEVAREAVLTAAHETLRSISSGPHAAARLPIADLPLGKGHAWTLTESPVPTPQPEQVVESSLADLPAWSAASDLDLLADAVFGAIAGTSVLAHVTQKTGPVAARQVAIASYSRYGFEAAAVTHLAVLTSAVIFAHQGVERALRVRFGRPYAVIASVDLPLGGPSGGEPDWTGLPLFTAWVTGPTEPGD
jgi:hypothetical protein